MLQFFNTCMYSVKNMILRLTSVLPQFDWMKTDSYWSHHIARIGHFGLCTPSSPFQEPISGENFFERIQFVVNAEILVKCECIPFCQCLRAAVARTERWWRRCSSVGYWKPLCQRPSDTSVPDQYQCQRSRPHRTNGP